MARGCSLPCPAFASLFVLLRYGGAGEEFDVGNIGITAILKRTRCCVSVFVTFQPFLALVEPIGRPPFSSASRGG